MLQITTADEQRVRKGAKVQLGEIVVRVHVPRQQTAVRRELGDVDEFHRSVAVSDQILAASARGTATSRLLQQVRRVDHAGEESQVSQRHTFCFLNLTFQSFKTLFT